MNSSSSSPPSAKSPEDRLRALEAAARDLSTGMQNIAADQKAMLKILRGDTSLAMIGMHPGRIVRTAVAAAALVACLIGGAAGAVVAFVQVPYAIHDYLDAGVCTDGGATRVRP